MNDIALILLIIIDSIVIGFNLQLLDILKHQDKYKYLKVVDKND